jgi:hypothetical protein
MMVMVMVIVMVMIDACFGKSFDTKALRYFG